MANYDQRRRNTSSYASDENWDKNQGRYVDDNNYRQSSQDRSGYMDLDRDGNLGNTGGFYGGTSYLGSNYGADWNNDQNRGQGNYGASGYGNQFDDRQRRSDSYRQDQYRQERGRNQDYGNAGYGYGQSYDDRQGNRHQRGGEDWNYKAMSEMYGQGHSNAGDQGWQNRQGNYENRSQNFYESAYGNRYGNQGGYGNEYGRQENRDMRHATYGEVYHGNVDERARQSGQAQGGRYAGHQGDQYGAYNRNYGGGGYNERSQGDDRDWWDRTRDEVASWFGDRDAERRRETDRRMGEHKGKGPKEYRRSDSRIQEDISDRLADDDYLDASDIEVKVENGEVVLSGTVENRHAKRRAEDLVESVSGVRNVENRLRVGQMNTVGSSVVRSGTASSTDTQNRTDADTTANSI